MTTKQNAIAAMVNTMQAGAKAAKAKAAKAGKAVITLSQAEQVRIAREAGEAKGIELTQRETFDKAAKQLRDAKVIIGDARKCKVAQAFLAGRFGDAKVATQTKKNALTAFRKAVESGTAYNENAKRAEKSGRQKRRADRTESRQGRSRYRYQKGNAYRRCRNSNYLCLHNRSQRQCQKGIADSARLAQ